MKPCEAFKIDMVKKTYSLRGDVPQFVNVEDPHHCMVCNFTFNIMAPYYGVETQDFKPVLKDIL